MFVFKTCIFFNDFQGIIGPDRTGEAISVSSFLSSLPADRRPLQVSGSATGASLNDRQLYSNFLRVIPPDSTQVKVQSNLIVTYSMFLKSVENNIRWGFTSDPQSLTKHFMITFQTFEITASRSSACKISTMTQ